MRKSVCRDCGDDVNASFFERDDDVFCDKCWDGWESRSASVATTFKIECYRGGDRIVIRPEHRNRNATLEEIQEIIRLLQNAIRGG